MARPLLFGLAAGALLLGVPTAAGADVGAGVGASPIVLSSVADPGHTYRLPSLYVVNTGTVASAYRVRVERLSRGTGRTVPTGWVHFGRNDLSLGPKESASIPITLEVPANSAAGDYLSDLVAGTMAERASGGGAVIGAQAATKLVFRVSSGPPSFPWPSPGWAYAVAGTGLATGAAVMAQRRLGLRLRFERRR